MDINTLRALLTVTGLLCFLGIVVWAWSSKQRSEFTQAAHSVLIDSDVSLRGGRHE
jgi:cytochrome c oxidase cbb3-type subunit IV